MKEISKQASYFSRLTDALPLTLKNIAVFLISYIAANTEIFSGSVPFGTAFIAAAPPKYYLSAFLGVSAGYILPYTNAEIFRYIAAGAAIIAIKLFVYRMSRDFFTDTWAFITTSLLLFLTGAVTKGGSFPALMECLSEAIIGGVVAYSAHFTLKIKTDNFKTVKSTLSVGVTASVIIIGLYSVEVGIFSLGSVFSVILLLAAAEFGGVEKGVLCGTICGFSAFLSGLDGSVSMLFTIAGAVAGYLSFIGKIAVSSSALISAIVVAVFMDYPPYFVSVLSSFTVGSLIYSMLPNRVLGRVSVLFRKSDAQDGASGIQKLLKSRLSFTSDALVSIGDMIAEVSEKQAGEKRPSFEKVAVEVIGEACEGCSYLSFCWKKERKETLLALENIARYECEFGGPHGILEDSRWQRRCPRKERVEAALVKYYSKFRYELAADKEKREIRAAVREQYVGLSHLLSSLSQEFGESGSYNKELSLALLDAVSSLGVRVAESAVVTNEFGRMQIEMKLISQGTLPVSRAKLKEICETICERGFEIPEVVRSGKNHLISIAEKKKLCLEIGVYKIKADEKCPSGDTADYFSDGRGRFYLVLSDGMGSGSEAAEVSSMATGLFYRMISSGFGAACSLKLINSALMYRSYNESLATLDVAEVDLFSGRVNTYKAGSAPTFILKRGKAQKAGCKTLPIGILKSVSFDTSVTHLSAGDLIVMMTDGAISDSGEWIAEFIENFDGDSPSEIAENLGKEAAARFAGARLDDITVLAAFVQKEI